MKQLAASNGKLTGWVKNGRTDNENKKSEECEIDDDDWPEVEDPAVIIRKEMAKEKSRKSKIHFMCKTLILEEVMNHVQARAEANKVVERIIERSVWRLRINGVWKLLKDDDELQAVVIKKIRRQQIVLVETIEAMERSDRLEKRVEAKEKWKAKYEEGKVNNLEQMMSCLTVCSNELLGKEDEMQCVDMDWSQVEMVEHNFLESLMKELGIEEKWEDRGMEVDFDQEMDYLEDVLMNLADDVGIGVGDMFDTGEINDKDMVGGMMNGCLENIRMVMGESMDGNDLVVNEGACHSEGTWFLNN